MKYFIGISIVLLSFFIGMKTMPDGNKKLKPTIEVVKPEPVKLKYDITEYMKYCIEGYVFIHIRNLGASHQLKDSFNHGIRCEE